MADAVKSYFSDIDGTLTDSPESPWGNPKMRSIERLKRLLAAGERVYLWSGTGGDYATAFAAKYGIPATACMSKPHVIIDDNEAVACLRPADRMRYMTAEEFERGI